MAWACPPINQNFSSAVLNDHSSDSSSSSEGIDSVRVAGDIVPTAVAVQVTEQKRKTTYAVLVGGTVQNRPIGTYTVHPQTNKCLVKERLNDPNGEVSQVKLVLKSLAAEDVSGSPSQHQHPSNDLADNSDYSDKDNSIKSVYSHAHTTSSRRIIYTRDRRFNIRTKYPLPNKKAMEGKIGKGGNGFVFTMYHERKQYAVKKTVYRSNEVNVHSSLNHKNILPLAAVLMGEKHEQEARKFYCFHFMPKMDFDLRAIMSSKDVGNLKNFYKNTSTNSAKWDRGYANIKYIIAQTAEGLEYMHSNGYVHRDVKASNIMLGMRCNCRPLNCSCSRGFEVRLGDFDSAGTIPGIGIKEPTDQMIKFASILPLGTPGYRAPEVSMHIVLSGPYEVLYTAAVDIWSLGCLCMNLTLGKTPALKQREEASLLLSKAGFCSNELCKKTTKVYQ